MLVELTTGWTLVAALATILLGSALNRALPLLERGNIPPAVSAGLLLSLLLSGLRAAGVLDLRFATEPRDALLLVFFASLGFGAHLGKLFAAGKDALVLCLAITLAVLAQNGIGVAVARAFGEAPALGLFLGSAAYLGGHGTATAWASAPVAAGVPGAFEVGIGSATLGLVLGGLVAGPVAAWLSQRGTHQARGAAPFVAPPAVEAPQRESPLSSERWLLPLAGLIACVALAPHLRAWAAAQGLQLPAFLAALLTGVLITNLADASRRPFDTEATNLIGHVALRIFLAIAMLTLDWAQIAAQLPMLLVAASAQVVVTVAIAVGVVHLLFGRGSEGAAACGGFIGFGLGAMPVGLSVMRRLGARFGDTPRALLAVTLAASLYQDAANGLILTLWFGWLGGAAP